MSYGRTLLWFSSLTLTWGPLVDIILGAYILMTFETRLFGKSRQEITGERNIEFAFTIAAMHSSSLNEKRKSTTISSKRA
jgi:hypothetical protein